MVRGIISLLCYLLPIQLLSNDSTIIRTRPQFFIGYERDNAHRLILNTHSGSAAYVDNLFLNCQLKKFSFKVFVGFRQSVLKDRFKDYNRIAFSSEYILPIYKRRLLLGIGIDMGRLVKLDPNIRLQMLYNIGIASRFYLSISKRMDIIFEPLCVSWVDIQIESLIYQVKDVRFQTFGVSKAFALGIQFNFTR